MASHALSSSTSAAIVVASAPEDLAKKQEDLMKKTEEVLKMGGVSEMSANGPFEAYCSWLKTCSIDEILIVFPMILKGHELDELQERLNAYQLLNALLENSKFKDALQHLWNHMDCSSYFKSAKTFKGFCYALKKAGMGFERITSLQAASQKADVSLRTVACELLCQDVRPETEDLIFMAAYYCRNDDASKDLTVRCYRVLFKDGYFQRKKALNPELSLVINRAQEMLVSKEPKRMLAARIFFENFIEQATSEQFALLPNEIVEEWKENSADPTYEKDFKPLWEQYQKRAAEAVSSS